MKTAASTTPILDATTAAPAARVSERSATQTQSSMIWTYGVLGLPLAMLAYPMGTFLPDLYAKGVGLPLAVVGSMLALSRIGDSLTDPLMGFWSDRLPTRFGRRKPWIAAGTPVMLLGMWMLFHPPAAASQWYLVFWFFLMTVGTTLISIPYSAWGAELSTEYHGRTRVQHSREVFFLLGLMSGALVPFLVQDVFDLGNDSARVLSGMAAVLFVVVPTCAVLLLWRVPEPAYVAPRRPLGLGRSLRLMLRNGLLRNVLAIELIVTLGEAFRDALSIFFIRDYLGIPSVGRFYLVYFGVGLLAMPLWTQIARRFGKHRSLAGAMALVAIVSLGLFLLERGQTFEFYVLFALKGFCFGAFAYLPRAMLADVIDIDYARSKEQRAASYFSVHGIMTKSARALGPGLALPTLAWVGYSATLGTENGPNEIVLLGVLYAIVPTLFFLVALYMAWTYPLTMQRHARIEALLNRRRARAAAAAR